MIQLRYQYHAFALSVISNGFMMPVEVVRSHTISLIFRLQALSRIVSVDEVYNKRVVEGRVYNCGYPRCQVCPIGGINAKNYPYN